MGEKTYTHLSALGYTCIWRLGTSLEYRIRKKERQLPTWHLHWCLPGILTTARTEFLISPLPATYFSNSPKAKNHSSFLYFSGSQNYNLSASLVALLRIYTVNLPTFHVHCFLLFKSIIISHLDDCHSFHPLLLTIPEFINHTTAKRIILKCISPPLKTNDVLSCFEQNRSRWNKVLRDLVPAHLSYPYALCCSHKGLFGTCCPPKKRHTSYFAIHAFIFAIRIFPCLPVMLFSIFSHGWVNLIQFSA